jgi:hypothetical protein
MSKEGKDLKFLSPLSDLMHEFLREKWGKMGLRLPLHPAGRHALQSGPISR